VVPSFVGVDGIFDFKEMLVVGDALVERMRSVSGVFFVFVSAAFYSFVDGFLG
jgi:hypothetical protein